MNFNKIKSPKVTKNKSGLIPTGFKVVVKMDELEEATAGGIIIPSNVKDVENAGAQSGRMVDHGPAAFSIGISDLPKEWDVFPDIGARVLINRYAGIQVDGKDGGKYRFIHDKEVLAIFNEENDNV